MRWERLSLQRIRDRAFCGSDRGTRYHRQGQINRVIYCVEMILGNKYMSLDFRCTIVLLGRESEYSVSIVIQHHEYTQNDREIPVRWWRQSVASRCNTIGLVPY